MRFSILFFVLMAGLGAPAAAPLAAQDPYPVVESRNLSGPRLGVTALRTRRWRNEVSVEPQLHVLSQFGWHFEYQVVPRGGGPQFVVQWVPMVGGVELGTLVPSVTLALGVRFPSGIEFGMGPNLIYVGEAITSLIVGAGKSFDFGGVSIPLNLVYAMSADRADRLSFVMGYALRRN